jgi:uncharacterized membrane protein
MSEQNAAALPGGRLVFIDLLRGWAILVMIEVHVFNAFIIQDLKSTAWFNYLNFINGLVAPSFTFISGFVFLLASQKKLESFRTYGPAFWKQIGRIALIWIIGYALHLPFFSFYRSLTESTESQLLSFYQSNVLHCIAFGLLFLFLLRLLIKKDRTYKAVLLIAGFMNVAITLFIWDYDFTLWMPAPVAAYMNSQHYSIFPLFPWLAFMLFGGYFAAGYIKAREEQKEKSFIGRFAILGTIMITVALIAKIFAFDIPGGSNDIRANPFFFFERLGIVMLLLSLCWIYAEYRKTEKSFVLDASRESLMVYTTHLLVIYGRFWNGKSLAYYAGESFSVIQCIIATVCLAIVMIAAAKGWGWLKLNHKPLAKSAFWVFSGSASILFFFT